MNLNMDQLLEASNIKTEPIDPISRDELEISTEMHVESMKQEDNYLIHRELGIKIEPQEDENKFSIIASTSNILCPNYNMKMNMDESIVKIEYDDPLGGIMQDPLDIHSGIEGEEHVPIDLNEEPRIKTEPRDRERDKNLLESDEDPELYGSASNFHIQKDKKHTCHVCNKVFTLKWMLDRHLRIHTGEKPYTCYVCEKSFIEKGKLDRHMLIHSDEKPYDCTVCKKVFRQKANLDRHKYIHSGLKLFSCKDCNKSFAQKTTLITHKLIHLGRKSFTCDFCKKAFVWKSNLIEHERTHTGKKPYSCDICNKSFAHSSTLTKHKKIHNN